MNMPEVNQQANQIPKRKAKPKRRERNTDINDDDL